MKKVYDKILIQVLLIVIILASYIGCSICPLNIELLLMILIAITTFILVTLVIKW